MSRMCISCQSRVLNLDDLIYSCTDNINIHRVNVHGRFGEHGHLRANNTSALVACLEDFTASDQSARTFSEYAAQYSCHTLIDSS